MAVKLNNFTLNTNFPSIAKMNSASRSCTLSAQTLASYQTVSASVNVSVGSGDICETLLYVDSNYIPAPYYSSGSLDGIEYEYVIERVSAAQIRFSIYATNWGLYSVSIPAKTASVLVSAFSVP